ncbi:MAG: class I SAM-dependent methyltransferase [Verrucomicrobia bacterium]|nr:class I SAM-dependent methyltransferase [Verrucomicrobiota bacterium]
MAINMALNCICPYYTMFPVEFPLEHLADMDKGWVLDPFCGRGTTLYAARKLGHSAVGIDINPIAVTVARAKLSSSSPQQIIKLAEKLLDLDPDPSPSGDFWRWAFNRETFDQILRLRRGLRGRSGSVVESLRAIILGALHGPVLKTKISYFSNQMPRTFATKPDYSVRYWSQRGMTPPKANVLEIIKERAERFFETSLPRCEGKVLKKDACKQTNFHIKFDAIITSPPYFGMTTYLPDQWLRFWFLGGPDRPSYRDHRQVALGSKEHFIRNLSRVWENAARNSKSTARLIIRFGALSSAKSDPSEIIAESIRNTGWNIQTIKDAGFAEGSARQAEQMGLNAKKSKAVQEIDVICFKGNKLI